MNKLGKIVVLNDNRLSRQRATELTRILNMFRVYADVRLLDGSLDEDQFLLKMEELQGSLFLIPWYRYLSWSKAEAFYGLTRTSGPTIAGYHFGGVTVDDLGTPDHLRTILLDFAGPSPQDVGHMVRNLLVDTERSGLVALLENKTKNTIYCENWMDQQGLGNRIDALMNIPEIGKTEWVSRSGAIRIILSALWSLVYEEGPGKSEFAQALTAGQAKAWFQVGAQSNCLAFRLIYSMPTWSPKDALGNFWPTHERPSSPAQLLRRYSDLLRIHRVADSPDIEVVAALYRAAPAERSPGNIHTLWIEPLAARLINEAPYEKLGPEKPHLKPLNLSLPPRPDETQNAAREQAINDLALQVKELRRALREKETKIEELRMGGVGAAQPSPVDADGLLEAFLERFYSAHSKAQELQEKVRAFSESAPHPNKASEIAQLEKQIQALMAKEGEWIKKLADALRYYAEDRKKLRPAA
jgi:hypothetical protein